MIPVVRPQATQQIIIKLQARSPHSRNRVGCEVGFVFAEEHFPQQVGCREQFHAKALDDISKGNSGCHHFMRLLFLDLFAIPQTSDPHPAGIAPLRRFSRIVAQFREVSIIGFFFRVEFTVTVSHHNSCSAMASARAFRTKSTVGKSGCPTAARTADENSN